MLSALLFCLVLEFSCSIEEVFVQLPEGKSRGFIEKSEDGRDYVAFYGIPYASPPIGKRRFRRPVPIERWDSIKGGEIIECAQEETGNEALLNWQNPLRGVEDCLVVNIYTPKVGHGDYPVMVFFHGGGYFAGVYASAGRIFN